MPQGILADLFRFLRRASAVHEGQGLSDGALLERFLTRREEAAFEILMQRHGPMVLGVCQRVAGDAHAAEDAFQATFFVLARRAASIRKQASVGSWLHGVAQRIASKAKAQAAARRDRERRAADMPRSAPLDERTWQELRTILDEELNRLPEKYRAAIVLCYLEGKSYEQAAQELGWPKSSLASRLTKACELLRGQLTRRGIALSAGALATALTEKASAAPVGALLAINIVKAAASVAAGKTLAAGCLSTNAIALVEETMKTTIGITGKLIVLLAVLGLAVGAGLAGHSAWVAQVPPQPDEKQPPAVKGDPPKKAEPPAVALDRDGDPLPDGAIARLGTTRLRHPGARQVIFSTDGKTLLSTGPDRVVRRWEVSSGKLAGAQPIKLATGDTSAAPSYPYLSPDGKIVAVIGQKHLYFFDAATGKELHRVPQDFGAKGDQTGELISPQGQSCVAFTADGKQFGFLRRSGAFLLFDVATGKAIDTGLPEKLTMPLGKRSNVQAALDPSGKQLATYTLESPKEGVTLWDLSGGKVLDTIHFPDPPPAINLARGPGMMYSPAGNRLLLTSATEVVLWNTATGKKEAEYSDAATILSRRFYFSADGTRLAVAFEGTIHILDAKTLKEVRKLPNSLCQTFQFSPDGKTLAGLTGVGAIHLWNVADGKRLDNFDGQDIVARVVYSPDGKSLASAGTGETIIWDLETKKPRTTIRTTTYLKMRTLGTPELVFSADGKTLFAPADFGTVKGWNVADGKEIATTFLTADDEKGRETQNIRSLAVSCDGKRLTAIGTLRPDTGFPEENSLVVWDIASGKRLDCTTFSAKKSSHTIAFSPNGSYVTYVNDGNHVLYDFAEKQERVMGPNAGLGTLGWRGRFSHDSALLAIPSSPPGGGGRELPPSTVSVHETATGKLRITLPMPGHSDGMPAFAFTPDDRYLLIASPDEWHFCEIATGKEALHRPKEKGGALDVAPDGRSAAMSMPDATIVIWDLLPSSRLKGNLAAKDLEALWADLASEDAAKAYHAGGRLLSAPAMAWAFLDKQVRPTADETERIRRLIAALDDNDFEKRQAARKNLEQLGLLAEPELRKTLDGKPSAETSKAVKALLDDVWTVKTAEERRRTRAVWVLEQIGTADARKTLERLAGGVAAARQTRDAKSALLRLKAKE